jgi:hypothetical protein
MIKTLDANAKQAVSYCVPLWVRDEQVKLATARVKDRLERSYDLRTDPIACVSYGPSLNDTWETLRDFQYILTCSGAHKFLVERGIIPTWHLEVDPRAHKAALIGQPHTDVEYLIASACSPKLFDLLDGYTVKLWHIVDTQEEGMRTLPHGEWAITGGCSAGLRTLTMARFLGFTDLHVFGMDGCEGSTGKHAAAHPNQAKVSKETVYQGVTYRTTEAFLEAARGTFHELDQMTDVKATFYGEGLVQHMAKSYVPKPHPKGSPEIAILKEPLISDEYRALNTQLHRDNLAYGVGGGKYAPEVLKIADRLKTHSILDYGSGKGYLAKAIPFPIWEYDPAIPEKSASPRAADLVVCSDVLEHIEPDRLGFVLDDLKRCVKQIGYFVIHTGPAMKTLADGRNAHLIQQPAAWWTAQLEKFFQVGKVDDLGGSLIRVIVGVKPKAKKAPAPSGLLLSFDHLKVRRDPYPIGCASAVLEPRLYQELARTFPPLDRFRAFGGGNKKWSLSEVNHPDQYAQFLAKTPSWLAFKRYVKSPEFIEQIRAVLQAHDLDVLSGVGKLKSRFEFSLLPADGGCLRPHTDIATKLVTLVVTMLPEAKDWPSAFGGGTDVLIPKNGALLDDYQAGFDAFDVVETFQYVPNQCVVFVKTANSWHGVQCTGEGSDLLRRTVTINVERAS